MAREDWLSIVENAYAIDLPRVEWLSGIVSATQGVLGKDLGACGYLYDATNPAEMVVHDFHATEKTPSGIDAEWFRAGVASYGEPYVKATYRCIPWAIASMTPGWSEGAGRTAFREKGFDDFVGINGVEPSGMGIWVGAPLAKVAKLSNARRDQFQRISTHLATAYRLRRLIEERSEDEPAWGAEAVLSPSGRLEHAAADESVRRATKALRDSVRDLDRARGRLRRSDPEKALGSWKGLVEGTWSLVDKFDRDGKRFVLARRNIAEFTGFDALSDRERQVVALAATGHSNKHIAYDLGIAHPTVRVLMLRASKKLGVATRDELVDVARRELLPKATSTD